MASLAVLHTCSSVVCPDPSKLACYLQINPNTAYVVSARAWVDDGYGLVGVTFFTGSGAKLAATAVKVAATADGMVSRGVHVAPPGAYFAALWAGKWTGGGKLQVCFSWSQN